MPKLSKQAFDERRRHILRTAETCFARDGFHRATIADVCREAGVSTGAVYVYFPNKEAIVRAILEDAQAERQAELRAVSAAQGGKTNQATRILLRWLTGIFTTKGRHATKLDLNLWAEAVRNPRVAKIAAAALTEATRTVSDLVSEGQRATGKATDLDPNAVATVLVSIFLGIEVQNGVGVSLDVDEILRVLGTLFDLSRVESEPGARVAPRLMKRRPA